jgi:hypothetical protein
VETECVWVRVRVCIMVSLRGWVLNLPLYTHVHVRAQTHSVSTLAQWVLHFTTTHIAVWSPVQQTVLGLGTKFLPLPNTKPSSPLADFYDSIADFLFRKSQIIIESFMAHFCAQNSRVFTVSTSGESFLRLGNKFRFRTLTWKYLGYSVSISW